MGDLDQLYWWNPMDGILLKSAIESGVSLESLAEGAVDFSKKYTIQQLEERSNSFCYGPDVYGGKTSSPSAKRKPEFEYTLVNMNSSCKRSYNDPSTSVDLKFINVADVNDVKDNCNSHNINNNNNNNNNVAATENFEDPIQNQFSIGNSNLDNAAMYNGDFVSDVIPLDENQCRVYSENSMFEDHIQNQFGIENLSLDMETFWMENFCCGDLLDVPLVENQYPVNEIDWINEFEKEVVECPVNEFEEEDEFPIIEFDWIIGTEEEDDLEILGRSSDSEITNNVITLTENDDPDMHANPKLGDGVICCVLNTKDTYIPVNALELGKEIICCALNAEDTNVPNNEDVFMINHIDPESSSPLTIGSWTFELELVSE